ncbi:hypothetical protein IWZ01DRAFT_16466 [Phyllosticta capitalensis]
MRCLVASLLSRLHHCTACSCPQFPRRRRPTLSVHSIYLATRDFKTTMRYRWLTREHHIRTKRKKTAICFFVFLFNFHQFSYRHVCLPAFLPALGSSTCCEGRLPPK